MALLLSFFATCFILVPLYFNSFISFFIHSLHFKAPQYCSAAATKGGSQRRDNTAEVSVCPCVCLCVCVSVCPSVCVCVCVCVSMCFRASMGESTYLCSCMNSSLYACMLYECMYVCFCECMYVCIYAGTLSAWRSLLLHYLYFIYL